MLKSKKIKVYAAEFLTAQLMNSSRRPRIKQIPGPLAGMLKTFCLWETLLTWL